MLCYVDILWFIYSSAILLKYLSKTDGRGLIYSKNNKTDIQLLLQCIFTRDSIICYSAHMLSPVRPSVRLSVCPSHGCIIEKRFTLGIMKFSPYGSPIPLVFAG